VIFCALARRPAGNHVARDGAGRAVIIPGRRFGEYLAVMRGLIRRYGAGEPTVAHALLRLLSSCAAVAADARRLEGRAADDAVKAGRITIEEAAQAMHHSFACLLSGPETP
jgi:uncharacterized membrane protein